MYCIYCSAGVPTGLQITQGPDNLTIAMETEVSMCCAARGFPAPTVQWFKDSHLLVNSSGLSLQNKGQLLVFKNVSEEDEGSYHCEARNERETVRSQTAYLLPAEMDWSFVLQPTNQTVRMGDSVTLVCRSPYSRPPATVSWFKNNRLLTPKTHFAVGPNGDLIFHSAHDTDRGVYFCRASNVHLYRSVTSRTARLTVLAPPSVRLWPPVVMVPVGAQVVFHCQVWGHPLPSIVWSKQGRSMQTGGKIAVGVRNATLYILSVRSYDEGTYTCAASNTVGHDRSTATLRVAVSPIIVSFVGAVSSSEGSSVVLPCRAVGDLPIRYTWTRGHSQTSITPTLERHVDDEGALHISSVQLSDAGDYHCAAENRAGRQQRRATLTISAEDDLAVRDKQHRQIVSAVPNTEAEQRTPLSSNVLSLAQRSEMTQLQAGSTVSVQASQRDLSNDITQVSTPDTLQLLSSLKKTALGLAGLSGGQTGLLVLPDLHSQLPLDQASAKPTQPTITQIQLPVLQPPHPPLNQPLDPLIQPSVTHRVLSLTQLTIIHTQPTLVHNPPPVTQRQVLVPHSQSQLTQSLSQSTHNQPSVMHIQHQVTDQLTQTQPEPTQTQPEPTQTQPEPTQTQPEPTQTQPEPTQAQPEPTQTQPQPTQTQNEPTQTQPKPTQTHPEPTQTQPEPTQTQPKPTQTQPEPTQSEHEPTQTQPELTQTHPEPTQTQPEPTQTQPEPTQTQPEPQQTQPTHLLTQPSVSITHPPDLSTIPPTPDPKGPSAPRTSNTDLLKQNMSQPTKPVHPAKPTRYNDTEPTEWLKRNTSQSPIRTSEDPRVKPPPVWLPVLEKHDIPIVVGVGVSLAFIFITMAFYSLVQKNEPAPAIRALSSTVPRNLGVPFRHAEHLATGRTYENRAFEDDDLVAVTEQSPNTSDTRARPPAPSPVTVMIDPASETQETQPRPPPIPEHSVIAETYPEPIEDTQVDPLLDEEKDCSLSHSSIQLQCVEDWGGGGVYGQCQGQDFLPEPPSLTPSPSRSPSPSPPPVREESLRSSLTLQTTEPCATPVRHSISISHGNAPLLLSHCISLGLTTVAVDVHFYPAALASATAAMATVTAATQVNATVAAAPGPQLSSRLAHSQEHDRVSN
uniref:Ig-like domain-containing protein n=1 Tax=Hucho hucho TaxID=62062 RepID=A0A4W5L8B1_9TELE